LLFEPDIIVLGLLSWRVIALLVLLRRAQTTKDWYFRTSCYSDRPKTKTLVRKRKFH